jgi:restriction system protein
MTIPTFDTCIEPLLRLLAKHPNGLRTTEVYEKLANHFQLTDDERAEVFPGRSQVVYQNRILWAHDRIKRKGLSSSPSRGLWKATEAGVKFVGARPKPFTAQEIQAIVRLEVDKAGQRNVDEGTGRSNQTIDTSIGNQSPVERIENALKELRESVAHDLLSAIAESSPRFFETLVLDVLHALGYGISRADVHHVGGSGDGGIDGIISLDRLGLEKVYIQAKRWGHAVGRPDIQSFYGALAGRRATKGVFITSSTFTREAREFASPIESIVLVDGARLAALMIEYGVGVTHEKRIVPKFDSDYFDES